MNTPIKILSLGAGIQSSTILLMACDGEIEKPDFVVFADTQAEREATYDQLEFLEFKAARAGLKIHRVSAGSLEQDIIEHIEGNKKRYAHPPFFCKNKDGQTSRIKKQCTRDYKIRPIRKAERSLVGPGRVFIEQWIGFSIDESRRCQNSLYTFTTNYYPLIDLGMSRQGCRKWLESHGYNIPSRSSCFFCPNRSDREWLEMKVMFPDEFERACRFDEQIRSGLPGMNSHCYLHRSLVPLRELEIVEDSQFEFMGCEVCGL